MESTPPVGTMTGKFYVEVTTKHTLSMISGRRDLAWRKGPTKDSFVTTVDGHEVHLSKNRIPTGVVYGMARKNAAGEPVEYAEEVVSTTHPHLTTATDAIRKLHESVSPQN